MLSGSFGKFPEVENISRKIKNHSYEHDLEGHTVKAIIQLDDNSSTINNKKILRGIVIDHQLIPHSDLLEDENGKYYINTDIKPRPIWTRFEIIGDNLVRVDNSFARSIAFDVLSHGLGATMDFVKPVHFDLQKLAGDYEGHWVGGIQDREGHMQSGVFWGDYIERDDVIGATYKKGTKNQVGFETEYFNNGSTKVRVTREGSIQVYSDINEEMYFQFIMDELAKYMVDAPKSKRRRTS